MPAGFWQLLLHQGDLPELFWTVKCMIVETSSLVLLKIFPGTSFVAECGLLWGLGEPHMQFCQRGSLERLHNTAWPSLLGKCSSILGCLGVQMEEEITSTPVRQLITSTGNFVHAIPFPVTWNWQGLVHPGCHRRISCG